MTTQCNVFKIYIKKNDPVIWYKFLKFWFHSHIRIDNARNILAAMLFYCIYLPKQKKINYFLWTYVTNMLQNRYLVKPAHKLQVSRSQNKKFWAVTSPKKPKEQICFSILTSRKYLKLEFGFQVSSRQDRKADSFFCFLREVSARQFFLRSTNL